MIRSIYTTTTKTYCFKCYKMTETVKEKGEYWKEIKILKGNCEVCNVLKVKRHVKRHGENKLLI